MSKVSQKGSRRCPRACARCRDMKVRCSGTHPCTRCERKRISCEFPLEENRVTVPESYIVSLQNLAQERAAHNNNNNNTTWPPTQPQARGAGTPESLPPLSTVWTYPLHGFRNPLQNEAGPSRNDGYANIATVDSGICETEGEASRHSSPPMGFGKNPLVDTGRTFAPDSNGKYWYMGPTSSWAFCRRVLRMLGRDDFEKVPTNPWSRNGFTLVWNPLEVDKQPHVGDLPTHDYAVLVVHTVKYHLGFLQEIIDLPSFLPRMASFYSNRAETAFRSRLWYAQFLLILAFGEAFGSLSSSSTPTGSRYAVRAFSLIPGFISVDGHSLEAIETLCLAALYLQSLDMRLMAYQFIGQALRLCIIDGMQRHMPHEQVTADYSKRCNTMFWVTYILDREFSALIGSPSSIRDIDITTKLPSELNNTDQASAMTLQIRLSRVTATIVTDIYGVDQNFDGSLIKNIQAVLQSLATLSGDLSSFLTATFQGIDIRTSKVGTRLILSYHYCVILTTRPLVMCVVQKRVSQGNSNPTTPIPDGPIKSLLESCVYSALNMLKTLNALSKDNLIESFLPFQLEAVFSSAFLLYIIDHVSPDFVPEPSWLPTAHAILDVMIQKGNQAASMRKEELLCLEQIMTSYLHAENQTRPAEVMLSPSIQRLSNPSAIEAAPTASSASIDREDIEWLDGSFPDELLGKYGGFLMSPDELLSLAEGLDSEQFSFTE